MATVQWNPGDTYVLPDHGGGIVLPSGEALTITGGGRMGYKMEKGEVPPDAVPGLQTYMEVRLVIEAVAFAINPEQKTALVR